MQLKCIAIDNEQWALDLIRKYVSKIPSLQLVQTMRDPEEAGEFLKNNHIDLLFIDVNIPKGIELVGSMITRPITIFTTAYKKYALKGFEFGVLDYLLKPLDFDRFCKATGRAIQLFKYIQHSKYREDEWLSVRSERQTIRIPLDEIEYIEGLVDYIRIHMVNDKPVLTLTSLKSILQKLPAEKFRRIHRSYIVAVSKIKAVQNKKLLLFSSIELPISDSYHDFSKDFT
jgi:two-component system LytT family response regulator